MRIIFPLAIVAIAARIGPLAALELAIVNPAEYAHIMHEAHLGIAVFDGTFLMMVAFNSSSTSTRDPLGSSDRVAGLALRQHPRRRDRLRAGADAALRGPERSTTFITAAIYGLLTFLLVDDLGAVLDRQAETMSDAAKGDLGAFLYLEVLDASFSLDGVIGAFALTQNLFVIAIGLGIGAMHVRSMTTMLVDRGTLAEYRYLEHGAFYAILILSVIMYAQAIVHVPEVLTGLGGATIIGVALWSSIRFNRDLAAES